MDLRKIEKYGVLWMPKGVLIEVNWRAIRMINDCLFERILNENLKIVTEYCILMLGVAGIVGLIRDLDITFSWFNSCLYFLTCPGNLFCDI